MWLSLLLTRDMISGSMGWGEGERLEARESGALEDDDEKSEL